jgi:transposase
LSNFLEIDTTALFQQAPLKQEWIPEEHLARVVLKMVLQMDLTAYAYRGNGSKAYRSATVLAMLIYGFLTGVFPSRKIETATYDSIAFRFIARNTRPDHRSLSAFRKRFQGEFKKLILRGPDQSKLAQAIEEYIRMGEQYTWANLMPS